LTGGLPIQGDADVDWYNKFNVYIRVRIVRYDRSFDDSDR
jgi:hypothetical protein